MAVRDVYCGRSSPELTNVRVRIAGVALTMTPHMADWAHVSTPQHRDLHISAPHVRERQHRSRHDGLDSAARTQPTGPRAMSDTGSSHGRPLDPFAPRVAGLLITTMPEPRTVAAMADIGSVTVATTAAEARALTSAGHFTGPEDVIVIDGAPSDAATLTTVQEFRRRGCSVMLVSPRCDELAVTAAWHYGVCAYVVTRASNRPCPPQPHDALPLSEREIAVLQAVADGATNSDIGATLGISGLTVKSHLARIGHKLGTGDRAAMVARVMRAGLIR